MLESMILILDNIRSLHNVGSILRTADGAGVDKVYLAGITPSPLDRFKKVRNQVAKTALGAENTVPWEHVPDTGTLIDELKKQGYQIVAVEQATGAVPYYKMRPETYEELPPTEETPPRVSGHYAFVFGHEVDGVSKTVLEKADKIIEIPMSGMKESLNVSISVGIIVFCARDNYFAD
ncbi:MAG: RNA methyltransferase [Candidatus Harrisonbacteria bacterium CG10_big_fil_rev_8_21_14_0_10_49_15]|uniref:RNA methyltransferase n=1 Tax=Candidatus Harrisonbacteria bacterium CG10_big_fil_rev_8_21_14_0_10_49_15 TaxID=1974587 RepID=A0A2H0UK02_9BACT|nr:MAG: RNA methyltransferase [Candidatus Harrisonbacteria bacterium CG10_big_fil_rev_8_21_14_0_10_49_15]